MNLNAIFPQEITHVMQDDPNDCLSACYAMILGIEKNGIPKFLDLPDPSGAEIDFQQKMGVASIRIPFVIDGAKYYEPEVTISRLSQINPGVPYILVVEGDSSAGVHTIVISHKGQVFDPAELYGNISEYFPIDTTRRGKSYWASYLVPSFSRQSEYHSRPPYNEGQRTDGK